MKYVKCPRCGLNYITEDQQLCNVCQDEINGIKSIFDDDFDDIICPICGRNKIGIDDLMCQQCYLKRCKKTDDL